MSCTSPSSPPCRMSPEDAPKARQLSTASRRIRQRQIQPAFGFAEAILHGHQREEPERDPVLVDAGYPRFVSRNRRPQPVADMAQAFVGDVGPALPAFRRNEQAQPADTARKSERRRSSDIPDCARRPAIAIPSASHGSAFNRASRSGRRPMSAL